jgi:hypothetical protein
VSPRVPLREAAAAAAGGTRESGAAFDLGVAAAKDFIVNGAGGLDDAAAAVVGVPRPASTSASDDGCAGGRGAYTPT